MLETLFRFLGLPCRPRRACPGGAPEGPGRPAAGLRAHRVDVGHGALPAACAGCVGLLRSRLLREKPDIVPTLVDREGLRALPEGSLGRACDLAFVESEGISPEGIRRGERRRGSRRPPRLSESSQYIHERMRDTHDLWHAATGYKGDVLGELALLAFTLAQNWNTAIAMTSAAAC